MIALENQFTTRTSIPSKTFVGRAIKNPRVCSIKDSYREKTSTAITLPSSCCGPANHARRDIPVLNVLRIVLERLAAPAPLSEDLVGNDPLT